MSPPIIGIRAQLAALTYGALLATILAHAWLANTPLPIGGPNVILGAAAVLLALSVALCDLLAGKRFVFVKNFIPLAVVSLLLMVWAAIVHVVNDTGPWLRVGKMGLGIGILCAVYLTVTSAGKAWFMIAAGIFAAFVSALFGLAIIYIGESFWSLWIVLADPSLLQMYPVLGSGRTAGLSSSTANFAYLAVIAIPSALAMFLYNPLRGRGARSAWDGVLLALLAVLVAALVVNMTRSALLGVVCGSFLVVVFPGARRQIVRRLPAIVLPAAAVSALSLIAINIAEPLPLLHLVEPPPAVTVAPPAVTVAPPAVTGCFHSLGRLSRKRSISGAWSGDCPTSLQREGSYTRYYSFVLEEDGPVTIDLDSTEEADAYLYLLDLFAGTKTGGEALVARNDNGARHVGLGQKDARITRTDLPAGTYTIEATTHYPETPGEFTLSVAPTACFHFLGSLSRKRSISGAWNGDCPMSLQREGSYTRYYSFVLEEDGPVTIDLGSTEEADAYLYLFAGTKTGSEALVAFNDNGARHVGPGRKDARIARADLPAGTYTIEATTYHPETPGEFTLSVAPTACFHFLGSLSRKRSISGAWSGDCPTSLQREGSYTRYYGFTLEEDGPVIIDLDSTEEANAYLYLFAVTKTGDEALVAFNDNGARHVGLGRKDARIARADLPAGAYTIEATTYHPETPGEFTLSVAPTACFHFLGSLSHKRSISGAWSGDCPTSLQREGSYTRYYSFILEEDGPVTIELDSTEEADAYLYLFGTTETGGEALVARNDNGARPVGLGRRDARITRADLPAGTYTIEATTDDPETPGEFTLNVAPTACFHFLGGLYRKRSISGAWSGGCPTSSQREGSYTRYYSFVLEEDGPVTIDLGSTEEADAYLYLFGATRTGGEVLVARNDDGARPVGPGRRDARITRTDLPAGTYTIEATTYHPEPLGEFTLSVAPSVAPTACFHFLGRLSRKRSISGAWSGDCPTSLQREGSYTRYYSFILEVDGSVIIELDSTEEANAYLYLFGIMENGDEALVDRNDNGARHVGLGRMDARIARSGLPAGTYTIEATTYHPETPGEFTLSVAPSVAPTVCFHPLGALSRKRSISATWGRVCPRSLQREGSYTRYYGFTLEEDGPVTIDLDSTEEADAYLSLFGATRTGGEVLVARNDDGARHVGLGRRDARITRTDLPAGTYTIEATTYYPETPGEFTLSVAPTVCFHFLGSLSFKRSISAPWSGGCRTPFQREGSYTRYYSFILEEDGPVTIDLGSTEEADAYLSLFAGTKTGGEALVALDDNGARHVGPGWRDARIARADLPAGTYTIEATTYHPETPGKFRLGIPSPRRLVDSSRIFSVGDESARTRLPMAAMAVRYALEHPFGTGEYSPDSSHIAPGTDPEIPRLILSRTPHNQFLEVLVYYGFPGLALLILFYVFALRSLVHSTRLAMRHRNTDALILIAAVAGGVTAYWINSVFQPHGPFVEDWHHFFLIGLLFGIQRICHEKSEPAPATDLSSGAAE